MTSLFKGHRKHLFVKFVHKTTVSQRG
jgi:hypothetical protein